MKIKRKRRIGRRKNNTTRQLLGRADDIAFRFYKASKNNKDEE